MTRAVVIDTEGRFYEADVDALDLDLVILAPTTLRDRFTDLDGSVVMLVQEQTKNYSAVNKNATALVAPRAERHNVYIRGDVLVVGEGVTENGYTLMDLPVTLGVADIEEVVRYFMSR